MLIDEASYFLVKMSQSMVTVGKNKPYWQVKTSILPVLSEPLHVTKSEGPNVCGTKTSPPGRAKR